MLKNKNTQVQSEEDMSFNENNRDTKNDPFRGTTIEGKD